MSNETGSRKTSSRAVWRVGGSCAAFLTAAVATPAIAAPAPSSAIANDCASVAQLNLPQVRIKHVESVPAGTFVSPPQASLMSDVSRQVLQNLPAFCRVSASVHPTSDSDINIEVWMPQSGWNGKFLGVGNGGFWGGVNFSQMKDAFTRGYAVASTDTGHSGGSPDAAWALGHLEKQVDFGHRAVHLMTVNAKQIVKAFYGQAPSYSYWQGCSSGGKQGLKEAQLYPEDYDGIVAGAPAQWWTHLISWEVYLAKAALADPQSYIPPSQYPLIHQAVMNRCDTIDGLKDGLISDPRQCTFKAAELNLQCKGAAAADCLTPKQLALLDTVYNPMRDRRGNILFPRLQPGAELGFETLLGSGPNRFYLPINHYKYVVKENPNWDFRTFDVDRDLPQAVAKDRSVGFDAYDPDLRSFKARGGKLLMWMGWADNFIAPELSTNYYEQVQAKTGGDVSSFFRLFMVPGMLHCSGGDGPDQFDALTAIEQWVERGVGPAQMASYQSGGWDATTVIRSRPICPYPQVSHYRGTGSSDDAASFECVQTN